VPLALLAALLAAPAAPAQGLTKSASSLELVPADAHFYSAMLRGREQLDAVLNSKAWARLNALPVAKMVRQQIEDAWNKPDGPQAQFQQWYAQEENQQLVRLLGDMFADEVFVYGGRNTADVLTLLSDLQAANQFGPLVALMQGADPNEIQNPQLRAKMMLHALADRADLIKAPDIVVGFKLRDTKSARAQLERLDAHVKAHIRKDQRLEGRWARAKVAGGDYYTLQFDGGMVPWEQVPWGDLEDNPGDLDALKKKLRDFKMSVSVGLRGQFLILALTDSPDALKSLGGEGRRLADREEFKPLAQYADRRLTGLSYASKEWRALEGGGTDLQAVAKEMMENLKDLNLTPQQKDRIRKDLKAFAADFQKYMPEPGAAVAVEFLGEQGIETYTYDWGKNPTVDASKPLTILGQLGGTPLLFYAERTVNDPEGYKLLSKWVRTGWGYVEEFGVARMPEEEREKYNAFMKEARPILTRLDRVTGEMLVPALAEGQSAFLLDAKLTSKRWHQNMPPAEKPLPLPLPAMVLGVKDADLLRKAAAEYRGIINDVIALAGKFNPAGPPQFKLPPPDGKEVEGGTVYSYPLPAEAGFDERLAPAAGLSKNWLTLALSPEQAARLLQPAPLQGTGKMLEVGKRPLASAAYLNWAGLVDAAAPWVDYALLAGQVDPDGSKDVRGQVRTVMEVLKTVRSVTSITYAEGKAMVTHGRVVIRDIE
jgi:hypothetical protein